MAERLAFGFLKLREHEFWQQSIRVLKRAFEWVQHADELMLAHTRIMCYYMGNHKSHSVEDMFPLPSELAKRQRDILEGRVPLATFKKLSAEEIINWTRA